MWSANRAVWEWLAAEADNHAMYTHSHPHQALRYTCSDEMKRAVTRSGSYFFSSNTMRFFRCRVYELVSGRFLIISNLSPEGRVYQVTYVTQHKEGGVLTMERGPYLSTLARARGFARELVTLLDAVPTVQALTLRVQSFAEERAQ